MPVMADSPASDSWCCCRSDRSRWPTPSSTGSWPISLLLVRQRDLSTRPLAADGGPMNESHHDGTRVALDVLVVAPRFVANADLLAPFGLATVEVSFGGQVAATRIAADPGGATSVPGIYVAGNVADPQAQVITSAAAGLMAGAAISMDLVAEDARHAVTMVSKRKSA